MAWRLAPGDFSECNGAAQCGLYKLVPIHADGGSTGVILSVIATVMHVLKYLAISVLTYSTVVASAY